MHRVRIYSLRTVNDKSIISLDLTRFVVAESYSHLSISLPTGIPDHPTHTINFNLAQWVNNMKVYDDGKHFFVLCTKNVDQDFIYRHLMQYMIDKMKRKAQKIEHFVERLQTELTAA